MTRLDKIAQIVSKSEALTIEINELSGFLSNLNDESGKIFDLTKLIVSTDSNVSDIIARTTTINEIISKFSSTKSASLIPLAKLDALLNNITKLMQRSEELRNQIDSNLKAHGGLKEFNYNNFHAVGLDNNTLNLSSFFINFFSDSESLVDSFYDIIHIIRPKSSFSFQSIVNTLSELIGKANDTYSNALVSASEIKKLRSELEAQKASASAILEQAERSSAEAVKDRQTISEYLAEVNEKRAGINTVHAASSELSEQIDAYKDDFKKFQASLDSRNADFEQGSSNLNKLIDELEIKAETIDGLTERARQMLTAATVSGLATHFGKIRDELTLELASARKSFLSGIVFLFVSATPLLILILLPIISLLLSMIYPEFAKAAESLGADSSKTGWQYLGQVVARLVILVPAAWFVSFTAIRHSSLFRLREHYSYKYSMAVSVEGFKLQAKDYEQEIAALVLEQLAFNPADKIVPSKDVQEGKAPYPLMQYFLKKFEKKLDASTPGG